MEKPVAVTRRVDELGRIVLPIELRKQAGIEKGEEFQISLRESSGEIVLKKVKPSGCWAEGAVLWRKVVKTVRKVSSCRQKRSRRERSWTVE